MPGCRSDPSGGQCRGRRVEARAEATSLKFFARAMAREFFRDYDPARARFPTYLRVCLD